MKRLLSRTATLTLAGALALAAGCATSPTGRSQLLMMSDAQMSQMGIAAFDQMKTADKVSTDRAKHAYVACIVTALVAELPEQWRAQPWEAQVFAVDSPNAFALPGGKIGVNTGMLRLAENQDQLAAVIGHEIGHVIASHANERVSQSTLAEAGSAALAAYVGRNASPDAVKQYVALLGAGAQVGVLLPFSRKHESEADVIGQQLMARAGFDPAAAAELWRNMLEVARKEGRPPRLLSTHPDPEQRIEILQRKAPELRADYEAARRQGRAPRCR
ncbi:MAG: M48 family metallopeptidase [Lysobacteraceae bacterium]